MAKRRSTEDPFHEREAQKYAQPIPSREFILEHLAQQGGPESFEQIAAALGLASEEDLEAQRRRQRAEERDGAVANQIVEAEIIEQPSKRAQPIGRIVTVLGDHMAPGMEVDIAVRSYDLPHEWPAEVLAEVAPLTAEVPEHAKQGREDLRAIPLVTIDGEDARDFDDAVYCEPHGKGWRLLVAIADVSSYVNTATALDQHARLRGTSVYFPGRVIPMLPEILSNGLCSLNPHVDRLCLVCELSISASGEVRGYRFFEGLMRSAARRTYTEVAAAVVERVVKAREQVKNVLPQLEHLHDLYKVLRTRRDKRGAIDFDTTETKVVFGRTGKIDRIVPLIRNAARRMIEEYMVAVFAAAAATTRSRNITRSCSIACATDPMRDSFKPCCCAV